MADVANDSTIKYLGPEGYARIVKWVFGDGEMARDFYRLSVDEFRAKYEYKDN